MTAHTPVHQPAAGRATVQATGRRAWRPVVIAMFCCGWGGNQFTPLLILYREAGYSVITVDALLGTYVVGLVPALLLTGGLSNRYGRKPVMLAGTAVALLASVLLALGEHGTIWIIAGRLLAGAGVGVAMAVGSTWVKELTDADPASSPGLGTRRPALWLTLGLAAGPGVAGVLAQWAPWPMVLPYVVHIVITAVALPFLLRSPETSGGPVTARGRRYTGIRHPRFRRVITPMAPWIFGSASVAYAIMPQLVDSRLGSWGLAYSTLLVVCTLGAGVAVQPLAKRLDRTTSARGVVVGMIVMSVGLGLSAVAAALRMPLLVLAVAIVLGAAYGIAVVSGLLELQRLARPEELAELTGVYYALAYIGFLFPSLLALLSSLATYTALLCGLAVIALAGTTVIVRHSRSHLPLKSGVGA
ncbi:MFS transporter [Pseudonocardia sp.]|jgi:MFS family permease|uniref:MFS transporter n=1 Tax=Pseudonocardia sp. TaxID=60912 RepID=UPI002DAF057D|nr:MFS transporter [Pseudonocardia sp.]